MSLDASDLVLCSGTLKREATFRERVSAALAGGFSGLSLWARDFRSALEGGLSKPDIRRMLEDNGLEVAEIDLAWSWLPGADRIMVPTELDEHELFCFEEADLFAVAEAVGARSLNAVDVFGGNWGLAAAADSFGALCQRAARHGLLVHIEFLPWSKIPDLQTAWDIVREAGEPNGGVAIDSWHFFHQANGDRSNLDVLLDVPGDKVLSLQLSDAPAGVEGDPSVASLHSRLLPGDGTLDLPKLLACARRVRASAPVGIEVFSDELHEMDPVEAGRRAGEAAHRLLGQPKTTS